MATVIGYIGMSTAPRANNGYACDMYAQPLASGAYQLSTWSQLRLTNGMFAQFGMVQALAYGSPQPVAYLEVWLQSGAILTLKYSPFDVSVNPDGTTTTNFLSTGWHYFEMKPKSGTMWGFYVDGVEKFTYDMGAGTADTSSLLQATIELPFTSGTSPTVVVSGAWFRNISELVNGQWSLVPSASIANSSLGSFEALPNCIQGNAQNSSFPKASFKVGTGLPVWPYPSGYLWQGATTPSPTPTPPPPPPTSTFPVTFSESGLPAGQQYTITVDGGSYSTKAGTDLVLQLASGIQHVYAYQPKVTTSGNRWRRKSYCTNMTGSVSAAGTATAQYAPC